MLYFHYELPYCGDNYVMLFSSQCSVEYSDFFTANARLRDVFGIRQNRSLLWKTNVNENIYPRTTRVQRLRFFTVKHYCDVLIYTYQMPLTRSMVLSK